MRPDQHTFHFEGIGIHTGKHTHIVVEVCPESNQVEFITPQGTIVVSPRVLSNKCNRSSDLICDSASVQTVEHLLFALCVFSWGAKIFVDGPEIPIMDGSALPFILAFQKKSPPPNMRFFELPNSVEVTVGKSVAQITPCAKDASPRYTVQLQFEHSGIGQMQHSFGPSEMDPIGELAPARTFALESEVQLLLQQQKGLGGSLANALVIGDNGPLNPEGMRFPDEPARHKLVDLIGDLSLLGALPFAHIFIKRPGHKLNHALVKSLWSVREKYSNL